MSHLLHLRIGSCFTLQATHQTHFLPEFSSIVVLQNGRIAAQGSWLELSTQPVLTELLAENKDSSSPRGGSGKGDANAPDSKEAPTSPAASAPTKPQSNMLDPAEDVRS